MCTIYPVFIEIDLCSQRDKEEDELHNDAIEKTRLLLLHDVVSMNTFELLHFHPLRGAGVIIRSQHITGQGFVGVEEGDLPPKIS